MLFDPLTPVDETLEAFDAVLRDALGRAAPGDRLVVSGFEHPSILAAGETWAAAAGVERSVRGLNPSSAASAGCASARCR